LGHDTATRRTNFHTSPHQLCSRAGSRASVVQRLRRAGHSPDLAASQRTRLLRAGIVLLDEDLHRRTPRVVVAGAGEGRIGRAVAEELGAAVEVEIASELPRLLVPRRCVGHMEREERRLQVRFVLYGDEHMDEIVVTEDDECVVVYEIVCAAVAGTSRDGCECPWSVYLDLPLGDRVVIDGATGSPVPYKNIWADMASSENP
jgi:hypothetical protein